MAVWKLALLTGAALAPLAAQAQRAESGQQGAAEQTGVPGSAGVDTIKVTCGADVLATLAVRTTG